MKTVLISFLAILGLSLCQTINYIEKRFLVVDQKTDKTGYVEDSDCFRNPDCHRNVTKCTENSCDFKTCYTNACVIELYGESESEPILQEEEVIFVETSSGSGGGEIYFEEDYEETIYEFSSNNNPEDNELIEENLEIYVSEEVEHVEGVSNENDDIFEEIHIEIEDDTNKYPDDYITPEDIKVITDLDVEIEVNVNIDFTHRNRKQNGVETNRNNEENHEKDNKSEENYGNFDSIEIEIDVEETSLNTATDDYITREDIDVYTDLDLEIEVNVNIDFTHRKKKLNGEEANNGTENENIEPDGQDPVIHDESFEDINIEVEVDYTGNDFNPSIDYSNNYISHDDISVYTDLDVEIEVNVNIDFTHRKKNSEKKLNENNGNYANDDELKENYNNFDDLEIEIDIDYGDLNPAHNINKESYNIQTAKENNLAQKDYVRLDDVKIVVDTDVEIEVNVNIDFTHRKTNSGEKVKEVENKSDNDTSTNLEENDDAYGEDLNIEIEVEELSPDFNNQENDDYITSNNVKIVVDLNVEIEVNVNIDFTQKRRNSKTWADEGYDKNNEANENENFIYEDYDIEVEVEVENNSSVDPNNQDHEDYISYHDVNIQYDVNVEIEVNVNIDFTHRSRFADENNLNYSSSNYKPNISQADEREDDSYANQDIEVNSEALHSKGKNTIENTQIFLGNSENSQDYNSSKNNSEKVSNDGLTGSIFMFMLSVFCILILIV